MLTYIVKFMSSKSVTRLEKIQKIDKLMDMFIPDQE